MDDSKANLPHYIRLAHIKRFLRIPPHKAKEIIEKYGVTTRKAGRCGRILLIERESFMAALTKARRRPAKAELPTVGPTFWRYADIQRELNIPRWMTRRICERYGVKAKRLFIANGNKRQPSVLIERESFLAALELMPDAFGLTKTKELEQ